jgi:hypothetical protein
MAVTMTTTTTKPAGATWWNVAYPDKAASLAVFCKNFPGVISAAATESSPTTWQNVMVFTDATAKNNFFAAINTQADATHRQSYHQANNFTRSFNFT